MHKSWMVGVVTMAVAAAGTSVIAESGAAVDAKAGIEQKADQAQAELKEMTVEGTVRMMSSGAVLVTADGAIVRLPMTAPANAGEVNLKTFDGATVKIVGMGVEQATIGAKKGVALKSIKTIEKVAATKIGG